MKAIDRAAYWTEELQRVGFDIEAQTDAMWGNEYMTVIATKGRARISYTIRMDSKFTRFGVGSVGFCGIYTHTTQVGKMSRMIFDWIRMENYSTRQEVSA